MQVNPRVDWRFATTCAMAMAFLFGTQAWMTQDVPSYGWALVRAFAAWSAWLALVPLIIAIARSHPLSIESKVRWVVFHSLLAVAVMFAHSLLTAIFRNVLGIPIGGGLGNATTQIFFANFAGDLLRYSLISLSYQVVAYIGLVRQREREAAQLQLDLAEAKLTNLEGRLRPHFLFNTLNTIAALIREDPRAAEVMLGQLSELLRASLSADPSREVRLDEELQLVEQYLAIQQVRFQDRLRVTVDVSPEARRAMVPQYLLQPLVENAVQHGIGPRESGGCVWVHAERANDRLQISVEDDGVGMGNAPASGAGNGIGLGSVQSRLAHRYGAAQRVTVAPRRPAGTKVFVEIPYTTSDSHDG